MRSVFQVRVRKPVDFVCSALRHFQPDCYLSLEGELSRCDPALVCGASRDPSALLRRNSTWPVQDFLILPVTAESTEIICHRILPQVGLKHRVIHVQLASAGRLVVAAYDNFDRECVWIDQEIGKDVIVSLVEAGTVGWYQPRQFDELAKTS